MAKITAWMCAGYDERGQACNARLLVGDTRVETVEHSWSGLKVKRTYCCFEHASRHFNMLDHAINPNKKRA